MLTLTWWRSCCCEFATEQSNRYDNFAPHQCAAITWLHRRITVRYTNGSPVQVYNVRAAWTRVMKWQSATTRRRVVYVHPAARDWRASRAGPQAMPRRRPAPASATPPTAKPPRDARVAPPAAKPITGDKRGAQTSCGRGLYIYLLPPSRRIPVDDDDDDDDERYTISWSLRKETN